jgi:hypothetical protein
VKGCHTWFVHGCMYVICVRFSPVGYISIRITRTILDMSGDLFDVPSHSIYFCSSKSCN